ncbi:MAG: AraC family transcriptional regulator [Nitrospirales bacterium]|nr:AraC family transcriptional regulator [Nitrospirales bacterium]
MDREKGDSLVTAIPGLSLFGGTFPHLQRATCTSGASAVAQGVKRVLLGDDVYVYDTYHFLITSVDLPMVAECDQSEPGEALSESPLEASDRREISQLMVDDNLFCRRIHNNHVADGTWREVTVPLLTLQRLIDLLAEPKDIPILAPIIQREIVYRLLVGDQGGVCAKWRRREVKATRSDGRLIAEESLHRSRYESRISQRKSI